MFLVFVVEIPDPSQLFFFRNMFSELRSEPACVACVRVTDIVVVYPHVSEQIVGAHTPSVGLTEVKFGHISYFHTISPFHWDLSPNSGSYQLFSLLQ